MKIFINLFLYFNLIFFRKSGLKKKGGGVYPILDSVFKFEDTPSKLTNHLLLSL